MDYGKNRKVLKPSLYCNHHLYSETIWNSTYSLPRKDTLILMQHNGSMYRWFLWFYSVEDCWSKTTGEPKYHEFHLVPGFCVGKKKHFSIPNPICKWAQQMNGDGYLDTLLMFLQEQEVFIYSLKEMCPLSHPQKLLSCPAVVTCLFLLPARKEVSAPTCSHCHVNYASVIMFFAYFVFLV